MVQGMELAMVQHISTQAMCSMMAEVAKHMVTLSKPFIEDQLRRQRESLSKGVVYEGIEFKGLGDRLPSEQELPQDERFKAHWEDAIVETLRAPDNVVGDMARTVAKATGFPIYDRGSGYLRTGIVSNDETEVDKLRHKLSAIKFVNSSSADGMAQDMVAVAAGVNKLTLDLRKDHVVLDLHTPQRVEQKESAPIVSADHSPLAAPCAPCKPPPPLPPSLVERNMMELSSSSLPLYDANDQVKCCSQCISCRVWFCCFHVAILQFNSLKVQKRLSLFCVCHNAIKLVCCSRFTPLQPACVQLNSITI